MLLESAWHKYLLCILLLYYLYKTRQYRINDLHVNTNKSRRVLIEATILHRRYMADNRLFMLHNFVKKNSYIYFNE